MDLENTGQDCLFYNYLNRFVLIFTPAKKSQKTGDSSNVLGKS